MKFLNIDTIAMFLLMIAGLNAGVSAVFDYDALGRGPQRRCLHRLLRPGRPERVLRDRRSHGRPPVA